MIMKKTYIDPAIRVVKLHTLSMLAASDRVTISSTKYDGTSTIQARGFGGFDDDEE